MANSVFYRLQGHPVWGRNPSKKQKKAAYADADGACCHCGKRVEWDVVRFHHLQRGIPNQHAPANMKPIHKGCHDKMHGVSNGSLT